MLRASRATGNWNPAQARSTFSFVTGKASAAYSKVN